MRASRFRLVFILGAMAFFAHAAPPPRFPPGAVWHQEISAAALHPQSQDMIERLQSLGGWGTGGMQIDFSLHVRQVGEGESPPRLPVVAHAGYGDYYVPDCEATGTTMPVPVDSAFEGQDGLSCDNFCDDEGEVGDSPLECGDCHLLVREGGLLYELYHGQLSNGQLDALCLAVWDLTVVYPPEGRGEHCTSADAAGFPIAPLLPNADEVAASVLDVDGDLGHAIRFILPNARMANDPNLGGTGGRLYVRPASHAGSPQGPVDSVPYGARLRLRSSFDVSAYTNPAARVLLRTMQRYGIVLADGGNIALTFESDRFTTAKWEALGIESRIFRDGEIGPAVQVTDFEVLDTGPRIAETFDCVRSAVEPGQGIFGDGFEMLAATQTLSRHSGS